MSRQGFRSEKHLVRLGRKVLRETIDELGTPVRARYEVPGPGGVPDLVLFSRRGASLNYVITVEFKLHDWRRALQQAFRNRNIGNESYVVLDASRATAALANVALFRKANVGLVTVARDQTAHCWHFPKPSLPFSAHFAEELAQELVSPLKRTQPDMPFIRSIRGGVALAALREAWDGHSNSPCAV